MSPDCLFCRIAAGDLQADVVYESEGVVAFRDIAPKAPVHVLVIPRAHHEDVAALGTADPALAGELLAAVAAVVDAAALADQGYRTIFNSGRHGGQEVFHVHAHVLGGRPLGPMVSR